ncbi:MAG: SBBP repeat-containing protein, partial [Bacteroidia bacterium]
MKNTIQSLTFVFTLFFYFSVSAQAPSYEWTRQMGSSTYDYGFGVTADSQGNVITTGYYQGTVDFDPGSGTTNLISNGNYDVFIQKLDTGGNLLWAKSIGGSNGDYGYTVVTDDNENVYVSGRFKGTVDFNPGTGVFNLGGSGGTHIFILKLDSDGDFVWAKKMGGSLNDYGRSITYDGFGNIITTGYFSGTVDFDPNSGTHQLISFGYDVFVQKMDTSGNFIWAKHVGSSSSDYGRGIVTDKDGDVYVTGYFVGTCDFDPGTGTANLTSAGGRDVFVLKLDSSGSYVWAKNMGGTSNDYGQSVVVDHQKNVYSTGYFEGTADFDPGTGTQNLVSSGLADIYIQKLDSNGDFSWVKHIGGTSGDFATYIAIDDYDHLYTTGYFWGSVDFDPGSGTTNLVSAGGPDIFIQKLDNTGALKWAYRMGGTDYDQGQTIITHPDGYIYSTGFFRGTSDLEPSTGTSTFLSAGNNDVYVQKLSQCTPILQYDTIESCGSYTWIDGITYSESNYTALHTISASAGCDTLAYLHLTLDSVLSSTDTKIACDSFTWINGMTYTSSNN